ncbi:hypothetical protein [Nocardia sp. NPDC056100]|uniref:hypothetical protein n=1 Tax=Nocardia sp. NPDC056100 TaxID=3345712 RepID=UPI0035DA5D4D
MAVGTVQRVRALLVRSKRIVPNGETMSGKPMSTLYDYQLAMLHTMVTAAPAPVAELLDRIGATHADAAAAGEWWRSPEISSDFGTLAGYVTAWGAPDSEESHPDGAHLAHYARWDLSFWPGLQIELSEFPQGPRHVFRRLIRKHGIPQPRLESVADLTPWSCTQEEFEASDLGPFDDFDGFGDIRVILDFDAVDAESGHKRRYSARFERGLLQSVKPVLVRLRKQEQVVAPDNTPIDDLILSGRTYFAVKKIMAEVEVSGSDAITESLRRRERLVRDRPNDFVAHDGSDRLA